MLVHRFVRNEDGEAFSILMHRYADMVYSTCRRVLGDDGQASDAVQETFFDFLKNADRVTGSLGSWLHRVATRRAVDLIRSNASRRHREQRYALDSECRNSTWAEVETQVDEAMEALPDSLREVLVLHFLERKSMTQIAAAKGLSQPTISRRIAEGLEELRRRLGGRGVPLGVVPLQGILLHTAQAAPENLLRALGKIGLAKAVCTKASSMPVILAGAKLALAGATAIMMVVAIRTMIPARVSTQHPVPNAQPSPPNSTLMPVTEGAYQASSAEAGPESHPITVSNQRKFPSSFMPNERTPTEEASSPQVIQKPNSTPQPVVTRGDWNVPQHSAIPQVAVDPRTGGGPVPHGFGFPQTQWPGTRMYSPQFLTFSFRTQVPATRTSQPNTGVQPGIYSLDKIRISGAVPNSQNPCALAPVFPAYLYHYNRTWVGPNGTTSSHLLTDPVKSVGR